MADRTGYPYYEEVAELLDDKITSEKWAEVIKQNGSREMPKALRREVEQIKIWAKTPDQAKEQIKYELHTSFGFKGEEIAGLPLYELSMLLLGCAIFYQEDSIGAREAYEELRDSRGGTVFWKEEYELKHELFIETQEEVNVLKKEVKRLKKQIKEQKGSVIRTIMLDTPKAKK